jgi:hypothetical protein
MAKKSLPNISHFPSIKEIQILWIVFPGDMEAYCFYRADPESIEWIKSTKVLRFTALCVEGEENDIEIAIQFTKTGVVLRYDLEDEGPVSVPMSWFEGPAGLMLDRRTRIEFLSVLIKPV